MNKVTVTIKPQNSITAHIPSMKVIEHNGTTDYNELENKPTLNGVEISGDKTAEDYGIVQEEVISDYGMLNNLPSINEHVLTGGENTLASLGIGRASSADINKLF